MTDLLPILETLIFISVEPLTPAKMKEVLDDVPAEDVDRALEELLRRYEAGEGAIRIIAAAGEPFLLDAGHVEDVAIEAGGVVLVKSDLRDLVTAIELSSYTLRKIKQNLFWAFAYNAVGIPVAMGALYGINGFLLSPVVAGAAMAFSSVSVVSNSLLMKGFKPRK